MGRLGSEEEGLLVVDTVKQELVELINIGSQVV